MGGCCVYSVPAGGPLSPDPTSNPDFFAWHRVQIRYCDGFSFTGHREQPVTVTLPDGNSVTLHVRGRDILLAALEQLLPLGLENAERVMLTGDSAGGLAVFHAADAVGEFLKDHAPKLRTYKAVPVSGFFLDHDDVEGVPQYGDALRRGFSFQNASGSMPVQCLDTATEDFKCFFAERRFPLMETPTFVLNSAMDYFQTLCILAGRVRTSGCTPIAGWEACRLDLNNCSAGQIAQMISFEEDFISTFKSSAAKASAASGAFLYSCHNHVAGDSVLFDRVTVAGRTMSEALSEWWGFESAVRAGAAGEEHERRRRRRGFGESFAEPCLWRASGAERRCNPTCYKKGIGGSISAGASGLLPL